MDGALFVALPILGSVAMSVALVLLIGEGPEGMEVGIIIASTVLLGCLFVLIGGLASQRPTKDPPAPPPPVADGARSRRPGLRAVLLTFLVLDIALVWRSLSIGVNPGDAIGFGLQAYGVLLAGIGLVLTWKYFLPLQIREALQGAGDYLRSLFGFGKKPSLDSHEEAITDLRRRINEIVNGVFFFESPGIFLVGLGLMAQWSAKLV